MRIARRFPEAVDTVVVGAGTAGAVVAGRLAAGSSGRTLLLEAGPDYGPADSGRWPRELLDAASCAMWSHDWGYAGEFGGEVIRFNRARVGLDELTPFQRAVTAGNTNMLVTVIGERIARSLLNPARP